MTFYHQTLPCDRKLCFELIKLGPGKLKGFIITTLISSLICLVSVLRSVEIIYAGSRSQRKYSPFGTAQKELMQFQIMQHGGDEVPRKSPWTTPYASVIDDSRYFLNETKDTRYIASNFSFSPGQGNLMFQYASLLAIAKKNNATLLIPETVLLRRSFDISATAISVQALFDLSKVYPRRVWKDCCRHYSAAEDLNVTSAMMLGYFQSWKYFHPHFEREIKREFDFLPELKSKAQNYVQEVLTKSGQDAKNVTFIGIHVRRGMDLTWNLRNLEHGHKIFTLTYLKKAVAHFRQKHPNALFLVCSDDIYWCRKNIIGADIYYVSSNHREVDLAILTQCNHTIMTQGTFSWWAAYLAGGDAVYYSGWPRKNSSLERMLERKDFFLPHWIGME